MDNLSISPREREVLQALVNGCTTVEVARRLYISPNTVKRHCADIFARLGCANRTQAVVIGLRAGLVHL